MRDKSLPVYGFGDYAVPPVCGPTPHPPQGSKKKPGSFWGDYQECGAWREGACTESLPCVRLSGSAVRTTNRKITVIVVKWQLLLVCQARQTEL